MDVYADGELVGPLPATMVAQPRALTVRVPSHRTDAPGSALRFRSP